MRIIFFGTPELSVPSLQALLTTGHEIVAVYTQPPRPYGRGHKIKPSPVHEFAAAHGIEVLTPTSLRGKEVQEYMASFEPDVSIVVSYGLILPQAVLDIPTYGCINVHWSLLPRWRGAAPIHRAILAGDKMTGITIMQMDAGMDTGDILLQESLAITPLITLEQLQDDLSKLGVKLLLNVLEQLEAGTIKRTPQPEEGVTYAEKITREDGRINWSTSAQQIERQVRALHSWPGAWFEYSGMHIKVKEVQVVEREGKVGEVIDEPLVVACGEKALCLNVVQPESRKTMPVKDFLRGHKLPVGTQLN